jgi:Leucine-rich repeat (LRR) protein
MKKLLVAMFVALLLAGCGEDNTSALAPPVVEPVKAPFVEKWAEWEANPEPYGGLKTLAKIKEARKSSATLLFLNNNEITDLSPLAGLAKLESLYLDNNQISDLTLLKGLTSLEFLLLDNNEITDLTPLAGLTNLEELFLSSNQISDLSPLKGLTKMEGLYLRGNEISDISLLARFTNLERLNLQGNPISEDQMAMLKKALPNCKIEF